MTIQNRQHTKVIMTLSLAGLSVGCYGVDFDTENGILSYGSISYEHGYEMAQSANLNADSYRLDVSAGKTSQYNIGLTADKITTRPSLGTLTLYESVGSGRLTLPDDWVKVGRTDNIDLADLKAVKINAERKRIAGDVTLMSGTGWQVRLNMGRDKKQGLKKAGAAIATNTDEIVRNIKAVIIPEPVDHVTDRSNLTFDYQQEKYQFQAKLHVSRFNNNNDSLSWENQFLVGPDLAMLSLEPDNTFYQASVVGSYKLSDATRVTASVSSGIMKQDQAYLPSSVIDDDLNAQLPQSSLDGEVFVNSIGLKVSSRLSDKIRVNAKYHFKERDNNSPQKTYDVPLLDYPLYDLYSNQPYSYKNHDFDLSVNYQLNSALDFKLGFEHEDVKRRRAEVTESTEDMVTGRVDYDITPQWNIALSTGHGKRAGSSYVPFSDPVTTTNPLLRKFDVADRLQHRYGVSVNYLPADNLIIAGSMNLLQDEYPDTNIGLHENDNLDTSLDINYQINEKINLHGFINRSKSQMSQAGSDAYPEPSIDPNWYVDIKDRFYSLGLGLEMLSVMPKLDMGIDYTHSRSRGRTIINDLTTGTSIVSEYPDLITNYKGLQLYGRYRFSPNLMGRLALVREKYDSSDWAYDGFDANSLTSLLLLGEESQRYSNTFVAFTIHYTF